MPCRAQARQAPRRCGVQALASQKHAILSFCFARLVYFKICMKSIEYISALRVIFWFFAMRIPKVDYFAMICLHSLIRGAWGLQERSRQRPVFAWRAGEPCQTCIGTATSAPRGPRGFASRGALWYDIAVWVINMEYEGYTKLKRMDEPDVLGMGDCMNLQTVEYIHPQWYTREFARERGLTGGDWQRFSQIPERYPDENTTVFAPQSRKEASVAWHRRFSTFLPVL